MATDYILFIHGVNTRERLEKPTYANELIERIEREVKSKSPNLMLKFIPLYWGDVNLEEEQKILGKLQKSDKWDQLWFQDFRSKQLMQFVGDAALYISRHVSSNVIKELAKQIKRELPQPVLEDRLHLVSHSWGTIILFDVLFAARWDDPNIPAFDSVQTIRQSIFGVKPERERGIRLASIHTMGSPIALFNLINLVADKTGTESTHDITSGLESLLEELFQARRQKPLPWRNLLHPGDPVAWPLANIMPDLVDQQKKYLDIEDVVTHNSDLSDILMLPFNQTPVSLLVNGGDAHGSYWKSKDVVNTITKAILQEAINPAVVAAP